jgi:hypothetical protein
VVEIESGEVLLRGGGISEFHKCEGNKEVERRD